MFNIPPSPLLPSKAGGTCGWRELVPSPVDNGVSLLLKVPRPRPKRLIDEWVRRGIDFALSKYDPLDESSSPVPRLSMTRWLHSREPKSALPGATMRGFATLRVCRKVTCLGCDDSKLSSQLDVDRMLFLSFNAATTANSSTNTKAARIHNRTQGGARAAQVCLKLHQGGPPRRG